MGTPHRSSRHSPPLHPGDAALVIAFVFIPIVGSHAEAASPSLQAQEFVYDRTRFALQGLRDGNWQRPALRIVRSVISVPA